MLPPELISLIGQGALSAVFGWLYLDLKKRYQEMLDKYEIQRQQREQQHAAEIVRLYDLRIFEIKMLGNLPTDLEGDYKAGPESRVKA